MTSTEVHVHRWTVASVHRVSDGVVIYERCDCGRWRVVAPTV